MANYSYPLIDIHTHKEKKADQIIQVVNLFPGQNIPVFQGKNFYSVGLHPWQLKSADENNEQLGWIEDALEYDHVIFVGETGPDSKSKADLSEQMRIFEAQAFMAEEFNKPLIIHCVNAYNEIIRVHKKMHPQQPWILHGYNGNLQETKQLVKHNIFFSFGELLFRKSAKALDSFQYLDFDRIFFETDESEHNIYNIYQQGAGIKNTSIEKIIEIVWQNFNGLENIEWIG
jgi:TatD DNase family protein